jgi:hypothetical protein
VSGWLALLAAAPLLAPAAFADDPAALEIDLAALADDPALAALDACRARLDARSDVGMDRIEKRCPGLMTALQRAPWHNLLPSGLRDRRDEVSAESLRELGELVRAANRAVAKRPAPDADSLAPVLAELGERGQQGATRWERFKRWLQDKLERREEDDGKQSWLAEIGREFETSEGIARLITYTGYGFMGLLVMFVVWTELRAAGLFGGGARNDARGNRAMDWRRRLLLADVMAAPLAERPGMLLKLLGEALTRADRLPAAEGLTAAALVRCARLDSDAERAELERVAAAAEAVRYGPSPPAPDRLEGAVKSARALLDKFARLATFRRSS